MENRYEEKWVLVVDDNEINLMLARHRLQACRLLVDTATSGMEALQKVKDKKYHLIFMDLLMPEMDGVETTEELRKSGPEYCKTVPVVALTANAEEEEREAVLSSGFDDFLVKPLDAKQLEQVLQKFLEAKEETLLEDGKAELPTEVIIKGIDCAQAMTTMHLDAATYLNILKNYKKELKSAVQRIRAEKEAGDIKGFVIDVHGVKSASAGVGAMKLSELAKALESAGKEENITYIESNLEEFIRCSEAVLQELEQYFEEEEDAADEINTTGVVSDSLAENDELRKCILVVDDSVTNLKFVDGVLKDRYKVHLVESGEQALEYLKEKQANLVLLDVLMPGLDGYETYRRIQKLELNRDVPVVFFTADLDVESEIKGLAMGAKDFIRKPFAPEVMKNRISNILQLDELTKNLEKLVVEKTSQVEQLSFEIIATIASMIEAKDSYTKGHSMRVAEYSALLAEGLGWKSEEIQNLKYIALLHDIGKVGIPDNVLNKPGKLTEVEFGIIKSHTTIGGDILKDIETIPYVDSGAKYHHEKYDGTGYPSGIAGKEIPEVARIIGIADAYDAMNSKRIYRNSMPPEVIRRELVNGRGRQFDPDFLDVFLKLLDEGKLNLTSEKESKEKTIIGEGTQMIQQIMQSIEEETKKTEGKDYLTGLLNRKSGEARIKQLMQEMPGCLAFIDLDNLKRTNDTMGHLAGDYALMTAGEVLNEYGNDAVVMRLGGDEFVYYMIDVTRDEAEERISRIFESFQNRKTQSTYLSVSDLSAGLCMVNKEDIYEETLIKADKALYYVKQRGKKNYFFYKEHMVEETKNSSTDLERLVSSLKQQGAYTGSMKVEYREFAKIYDFISHLTERYQHQMQLIMVTLQPAMAGTLYIDEIEHAMSCMEKTIQASLRTVDVCTRFSSEQFLIILMDAEKEMIDMISGRIFANFKKIYNGKEMILDYDVAELPK